MRKDKGKPKKDITGIRSGRLEAVKFSHMEPGGHGSVWECLCDCGKVHFTRGAHLTSGVVVSCGCYKKEMFKEWSDSKCGEKNPAWKGGKTIKGGYVYVITEFKDRHNKPMYIAEHREIMAGKLGRPLEEWEVVHHKNGIKTDNRIKNLELLTKNTHKGRVECPHCNKTFLIR